MLSLLRRFTIVGISLLMPIAASAQAVITSGIPGCDFSTGKITPACVPQFIGHLIEIVFGLVSSFFIINVMYAGYEIAMGAYTGGSENGKVRLRMSIIGLIVCASAFLILDVILTVVLG